MNTITMKVSLLAVLITCTAMHVQGALVQGNDPAVAGNGLPAQDGWNITYDTGTNLSWLDLTLSLDLSHAAVSGGFGEGGQFEGFRYATWEEFATLVDNAEVYQSGTRRPPDPDTFTFVAMVGDVGLFPEPSVSAFGHTAPFEAFIPVAGVYANMEEPDPFSYVFNRYHDYDPLTGEQIASLTLTPYLGGGGMAITRSGRFFSQTEGGSACRLVEIDPVTGAVTTIGPGGPTFSSMAGMAFGLDGTLYGVTRKLWTIDVETGAAASVGNNGQEYRTIRGADLSVSNDGTIIMTARDGWGQRNLYTLDPGTGAATLVTTIPRDFWAPAVASCAKALPPHPSQRPR